MFAHFLGDRFFQLSAWYALLMIRGRTLVASAYTICSKTVSTLPHDEASFRVELEHAPSRTSATVIWTAYLCTSAGLPRTSAQTTVSWAKFLGTPPPIMNRPDTGDWILISVSSRKSLTESIAT